MEFKVTIRLPYTSQGRARSATRKMTIHADDHGEAVEKAKRRLQQIPSYEVKRAYV